MEKKLQEYISQLEANLIEYKETIEPYESILDEGEQLNLDDEEIYYIFVGKSEECERIIGELKKL